jgi:hypothetical protein
MEAAIAPIPGPSDVKPGPKRLDPRQQHQRSADGRMCVGAKLLTYQLLRSTQIDKEEVLPHIA